VTTRIVYATQSEFKQHELAEWIDCGSLLDGSRVKETITFDVRRVNVKEVLEVDLEEMVRQEAKQAYEQLRVPCIVEHAGLVFSHRADKGYPGGLTKPMWNALGTDFIEETATAGKRATARAVVGYCDGSTVHTFVGETPGEISDSPRGSRAFYWDTVFVPDVPEGGPRGLTYAEIVDSPDFGLGYKVCELSQSFKAMKRFIAHRLAHKPKLWDTRYG
jgi:XTP/dITP diphosphohydrolase